MLHLFCFVFNPGKLNVHEIKPVSSEEQMSAATSQEPSPEGESLDNRYLQGDFDDVDPAILEKLAVYIARYSYDPGQHSPNENPEMELAFQAGDYLYVFGEMDEVRRKFRLKQNSKIICSNKLLVVKKKMRFCLCFNSLVNKGYDTHTSR